MTRAVVGAAVAAGTVGAVAASLGSLSGGIIWGVAAGVVLGMLAAWRTDRTHVRIAGQLRRWLTDERATGAVVAPAAGGIRELVAALNEVGEKFTAQRDALTVDHPWRHELVHSLVSPAVLFDARGHLVVANGAARALLSMPDDAGERTTVIQALGSAVLADAVSRARVRQELVEVEAELGDRLVHASVAIVGDETLVIVTDRTRERRVEELRRDFVVNASHELKTPATAIQTLSEALEITAIRDPAKVPDLVARLREASERLVRLVHDLLNLRRLEDREDVHQQPVDLVEVARDVLAELADRAQRRQVELSLSSPAEAWMAGDPDDVRLVVRNLVANGIQYNREHGRVEVRVADTPDGWWSLDVADTGIGIPQQDLQRIFERFYRVDVARSRETGGTGLGLSIVRHAVERHHGTIRVDSLLGEGTTFRVMFPLDVDVP